jgi:hypothetical protein
MELEEIFNKRQIRALQDGREGRNALKKFAKKAATGWQFGGDRPVLICGDPGQGKTYLIKYYLKEDNIDFYQTPATSSIFGLAVHLAKLSFDFSEERVVVLFDDVSKFFKGDGLDILKRLFEEKILDYSVQTNWALIPEEAEEAVRSFQNTSGLGFTVDCSNFQFITTANTILPDFLRVNQLLKKNDGIENEKISRARDMAAIRDRCRTLDLSWSPEVQWGNIAEVLLYDGGCDQYELPFEKKLIILDWLWNHIEDVRNMSIRTAEQMAEMMLEYPQKSDYEEMWWTVHLNQKGRYE